MMTVPGFVFANVSINEIMYDLESADSDREWVEVFNDSSAEIDLTGWKFNDGDGATNHGLNEPPKNGGQGFIIIPAAGYAIFTGDAAAFLSEHSGYSGTVIDTVMSLNNSSSTLKLIDGIGSEISSAFYSSTMGAKGDGNSLQYINGNWLAASPTPGSVNIAGGSQPQTPQEPQTQQSSQSSSGSSASLPYIPPEKLPRIKADAGADKIVIVGANTEFRGQAFGLEDKPLDNARFLWTFGDGFTKEGQNITHFYQYPGEYTVVLNVSSGEYLTSDYILVKAMPNQIFISELKPADSNSWIELNNTSKEQLDISGWQLRFGSQIFIFPKSTLIRPGAYLAVSSLISNIILSGGKGAIELFYPGGFKADTFNYNGFLKENESFNRAENNKSFIARETPGGKNIVNSFLVSLPKQDVVKSSAFDSQAVGESKEAEKNNSIFAVNKNNFTAPETGVGLEGQEQEANVIKVGRENNSKSRISLYLLAVFGLIALSVGGVLFIRRNRGI